MVIASPSALGGALSKAEACTNDGPIEHLVDPEGVGSGSPSVVYAQSAKAQDGRDLVAAELPSVAVGAHGLPRELAPADAEAAYVAAHKDFLVRREAVAQPQTQHRIDPLDHVRAGRREAERVIDVHPAH